MSHNNSADNCNSNCKFKTIDVKGKAQTVLNMGSFA